MQLGTFQPIDRLHGNHSDRLPWQYGTAAKASAEKFLNLREKLVPVHVHAGRSRPTATGIPVVRPLYLQYPDEQDAYAQAGTEYLYGPDVLVAPVTTPGTTATTLGLVPARQHVDGLLHRQDLRRRHDAERRPPTLDTMPVFIRSGGIMTTRTDNVTNDVQNPLTKVTVTVAGGRSGSFALYEDNGTTTDLRQSATTRVSYTEAGPSHTIRISPVAGSFAGQVSQRQWTVAFLNATAPTTVTINEHQVPASSWRWDAATSTLTVTAPTQSVRHPLTISYH